MSGDGVKRVSYAGNAIVQSNEAPPVQVPSAQVQYAGSSSWGSGKEPLPSAAGLDIRDFIVGNSKMTDANFEETFRKALAWAYDNISASGAGGSGYDLVVPPGQWRFSAKVRFPGYAGYDRMTPGIRGAGSLRTNFIFPHAINDACFEIGNPDGTPGYVWFQTLQGFCVTHDAPGQGGAGIGIASYMGYRQTFRDVQAAGWNANQPYTSGMGFRISGNSWGNAQHLYMDRCISSQNQVGYYFDNIWPSTLLDLNANQCTWLDAVISQCIGMGWYGGNLQSANNTGYKDIFWHGGALTPCIRTGWRATKKPQNGPTLASGTGAILDPAVRDAYGYGKSHVRGLSGLAEDDRYRSLVLTDPSAATPASDMISGLYTIEQIVSATECIIDKGTSHALKTGLTWQVLGNLGANYVQISGYPYHEGERRALLLALPDDETSSQYALRGVMAGNLEHGGGAVLEAHGVLGRVSARELAQIGDVTKALKLSGVYSADTDVSITQVDTDGYSREGLLCYQGSPPATIYQASSDAKRLNSFVRERGAFAAWDSRHGVTTAATNASAWVDFIGGAQAVLKNAGIYPQYLSGDSTFGGAPSLQMIAGTPDPQQPGAGFVARVTAVPNRDYEMTLFAVARAPARCSGTRMIWVCECAGTTPPTPQNAFSQRTMAIGFADGTYSNDIYGAIQVRGTLTQGAGYYVSPSIPWDSNAHAYLVADTTRQPARLATDVVPNAQFHAAATLGRAGVPMFVGFGDGYYPGRTQTLFIAYVALFPFAMSRNEQQQLMDLAAIEFKLPG